jgi:hypothetical protein
MGMISFDWRPVKISYYFISYLGCFIAYCRVWSIQTSYFMLGWTLRNHYAWLKFQGKHFSWTLRPSDILCLFTWPQTRTWQTTWHETILFSHLFPDWTPVTLQLHQVALDTAPITHGKFSITLSQSSRNSGRFDHGTYWQEQWVHLEIVPRLVAPESHLVSPVFPFKRPWIGIGIIIFMIFHVWDRAKCLHLPYTLSKWTEYSH